MREEQAKTKGFQRVRATQYDELRRQMVGKNSNIGADQVRGGVGQAGRGREWTGVAVDALGRSSFGAGHMRVGARGAGGAAG